jgi:N-methyl-L-proline demethylase
VDLRLNTFAERGDVLVEQPDLVIVATGGLPRNPLTGPAADLTHDTWDVMSGGVRLPRTMTGWPCASVS